MNKTTIHMAEDMGISRYVNEKDRQFGCRVLYSGLACWIKTAAADRLIGCSGAESGVSKRHITERCASVLQTLLRLNPELESWFDAENDADDSVRLIRDRLLRHGDLLAVGFQTNIALASKRDLQLTSQMESVVGEILSPDYRYSGISMVRPLKETSDNAGIVEPDVISWYNNYIKDAWWKACDRTSDFEQYFNPYQNTWANYSCWQDEPCKPLDGILFARNTINQTGTEFFLIRLSDRPKIHKLDPFLIETREHRRIMFAMRQMAQHPVPGFVKEAGDSVHFALYGHLPVKEQSLLESYAWPHDTITDTNKWIMPDFVWNELQPRFRIIGVSIMEDRHG